MTEQLRTRTIQLRAKEGADGIVEGYVTTWDSPYSISFDGCTKEKVKKRAFSTDQMIPLLYEHNHSAPPIGVSRSLREDETGLVAEFEVFTDTDAGKAVYRALKAKALKSFSVGFIPEKIEVERSAEQTLETIISGELLEVSAVLKPANPEANVTEVRAVPPAPVPAVDPAAVLDVEEPEKATKASLLGAIGELIDMADELGMLDNLPKMVAQYIKMLDATPEVAPEAAPAAPAAPPVPPARASDLNPTLRGLLGL